MSPLGLLRIASLPFDALSALHAGAALHEMEALLEHERALAAEIGPLSDRLFRAAGEPADDPARSKARFAVLRLRRDVHNGRAPRAADLDAAGALLDAESVARLARCAETLAQLQVAAAAWESAFEDELARGRQELLRLAGEPLVSHGILLASRSLHPKVRRLIARPPPRLGHDERHTVAKAAAYVARFAAKTSPNGVFCAVGLADLAGSATRIAGTPGIAHVEVLLSIAEARKVTACLAIDPAVEPAVVPRANPTLREGAGGWTFWKPASARNATDEEVHARVADQPVLRAFLEETRIGARCPAGLVDAVAARLGRGPAELRGFYEALVARGILIAEIEVPSLSRRPLRDLAAAVRSTQGARCDASWIDDLDEIEDAVDGIAGLPLPAREAAMDAIAARFETLPRKRPFKRDELFRVDAASSLKLQLPARVVEELRSSARVLVRLLAAMYPQRAAHREWIARFLKSYPPDTDVEFLDVYDGFAEKAETSPRPLEFPEGTSPIQRRVLEWFVRRAQESRPGETIELSESTLRSLAGNAEEPRWAAGALFQIAAPSTRDIDEGRYELVLNALFAGIGLALARFAHLLERGSERPITHELRRAWSALERPGAILAELTYRHEARTANAGLRPVLFAHEIELPGDLATPGIDAIPLSDLAIRYDSAADRLILRSRSRGLEVVPVLSSGVSPSGIVSELVHIGRQGWQTVGYLPGFHSDEIVRWPRFVCGKTVLFRARWVFRPGADPALPSGTSRGSDADFFLEVARWRGRHGLPRHVFVHTQAEPKPFYVDLEAPVLVDLLRRAISTLPPAAGAALFVTEMHPGPEELWVRDERGGYATEILVQLDGPFAAGRSS